ncbi:MAG: leucyl aminopeptidase family protein [Pacificimonas sp.]|jgi:leucyl aminopeptidase|nr:leucyl aminopeptidase family protein [Pacificimonas sp.]
MRKTVLIAAALATTAFAGSLAAASDIAFSTGALPDSGRIVVPVSKDGVLSGEARVADSQADGALSRAVEAADFEGGEGSTLALYGVAPFDAVLLVGTGEGLETAADLQDYGAYVAGATSGWSGTVSVAVPQIATIEGDAAHAALGARLGSYDFGRWKSIEDSEDSDADDGPTLTFHGDGEATWTGDRAAVAEGVVMARDLTWTPSNEKTPEWFAEQIRGAFRDVPNTSVRVLDVDEMERMGMGGILGVGKGSANPPRLIAVRYNSPDYDGAPLAFVGKGITFDTGGISLKPTSDMWKMRQDMAGAAAVLSTVKALAMRGAEIDVVAVAAMAENMPGSRAQKPGDVVETMSGKTFEIRSTDAEGRLVLTDALWFAQEEYNPRLAVTVATLTGSVFRALGDDYAGLFTHDDDLAELFLDAGEVSGEPLWRLPVHESVVEALEGDLADVLNGASGNPGASVGAAFVMEWAQDDVPFVHLDIAGKDWSDGQYPTEPTGATGYSVRLLDEIARRYEAE